MKQRGKFNRKFNKRKGNPKNNKGKFKKTRKKYKLNVQKQTQQVSKRKPNVFSSEHEETPPMQVEAVAEEQYSSESDEGSDHLTQLVSTFGSTKQKQGAIDSSDDDSSDDDDMEVSQEEQTQETAAKSEDSEVSDHEDAEEAELEAEPEKDTKDPFEKHFLFDLHEHFANDLQNNTAGCIHEQEFWTGIGKFSVQIPKNSNAAAEKEEVSLLERKVYATGGKPPQKINATKVSLSDVHIKTQIVENISKANESWKEATSSIPLTTLQTELFSLLNNYQDLYFPYRSFGNAEEIRFVYSLHAINHVLKTRTKVLHHNARLSNKDDIPEEFRDQGLVRPKVLIIVPFRDSAYKIIQNLIRILLPNDKGNVINKLRFLEEFTGGELIMPKKNPKPEDYELLFAGNSSDDFKIGITVTKKSLKLYADFYSSDIIIASPLGLRYIIGAEGEADRDYDFLASIELLILDQTEVFLMQNWDHLLHVFNHLHLQPKTLHGTDFSRVRTWSLNGWAKFYRQTLVFSSVMLPEINSIFNKRCCNYTGKIKVLNPVTSGTIGQVYVQLPHVFYKFSSNSANEVVDARFDFFTGKLLAQHQDTLMKQTLIYVSNYFDYVRLRNYFKKNDLSFVQICEYTKESKIARARDMFYHGDAHFMLYTDRFHFYHRKRIKGIRHLIFYQLPIMPHFYYEMCNLMQEGNMNKKIGTMSNMTVSVLYSKYDVQQLAAVVGTVKATKMVTSDKNVHMLLTG